MSSDTMLGPEDEKTFLLENALDAVVGVDEQNLVIFWNKNAEAIFGWSKEEIFGQDITEKIIPPALREGHRKGMQRFVATGVAKIQNRRIEINGLRKNGEIFPMELTVSSIRSIDGYRFYSFMRDVTEQKSAKDRLQTAKVEAERANQLKSAFLANMSHEIRTPLGAMIGFADLLRDPGLSREEHSNYIDVLSRNGEQLSLIINDILDLSKVEAGHLTLEYLPMRAEGIASEVIALLAVNAREKGLILEYRSDEPSSSEVISDPLRVREVLINLVSNAIKFTHAGSVKMRGSGYKNSDGKKMVAFEIVDTGIGIPTGQEHHIFETFVQGDGSMTRRFGGTGLGLALSRSLARQLGGDITVKVTEENLGSTFLFTFEDRPEQRSLLEVSAASIKSESFTFIEGSQPLEGIRVLVVDDSSDNRQLIAHLLKRVGATVESAENGMDGYTKGLSGNFDLILMDIQMPVMDGYAATTRLRIEGYRKPIIALTAHAMAEVRRHCLSAGCSDHLSKPINSKELIEKIAHYTIKRRGPDKVSGRPTIS